MGQRPARGERTDSPSFHQPSQQWTESPTAAREVFRADGFSALESGDDFYLTDGSSLLHLRPARGEGTAFIASLLFYQAPAPAK